jgi:hypothetical protein
MEGDDLLGKYRAKLKVILDAQQEALTKLAAELREEVVLPVCREHDLEFGVVHGRTMFKPREGDLGSSVEDELDAREKGHHELLPVFPILNLEIDPHGYDVLGFYVADVTYINPPGEDSDG